MLVSVYRRRLSVVRKVRNLVLFFYSIYLKFQFRPNSSEVSESIGQLKHLFKGCLCF